MKTNLTAQRIVVTGAQRVGAFEYNPSKFPDVKFTFAPGKNRESIGKPGIYVIVKDGVAVARTFVGQQEKSVGFNETVARVIGCCWKYTEGLPKKIYRSVVGHNKTHTVYHIPMAVLPRLMNIQQLELFEDNTNKYQSLTAVSRQLFKVYNFEYQKR
ncbi:hypothetical protein OFDDKENP_00178 [Aeromonas phage B614]|nr:host nucleoid disrupting protein [Aeromonas phage AhMtk13a]UYD57554.1 hypothetical protein OFDDKENP_00178 [Aeromonas phage B614]UYD58458.1 hypothetical protein IPAKJDPM_00115 [Aeromonas phage avDM14-QBC]UYD58674.1 hypothetical protein HNNIDBEH_00081 [Aeromonas phage avDM10-HWA]UYD59023.1 hypothetical protein OFOPOMKI_00173 [Aeromonas phage avDM7-IJDJ]UYD59835.1 hypothetical protein LEHPIFIF_00062 [Aeromonas phage avDM9-HANS]